MPEHNRARTTASAAGGPFRLQASVSTVAPQTLASDDERERRPRPLLPRGERSLACVSRHAAAPPRLLKPLLKLPRRPEQRGQDHRGQTDSEADDPAGDVLPHEYRAQEHGDTDDSARGDQPHSATLDLGATPLSAGHHALRRLVAPRFPLALAGLARRRAELRLVRGTLVRRGRLARFQGGHVCRLPGLGGPPSGRRESTDRRTARRTRRQRSRQPHTAARRHPAPSLRRAGVLPVRPAHRVTHHLAQRPVVQPNPGSVGRAGASWVGARGPRCVAAQRPARPTESVV